MRMSAISGVVVPYVGMLLFVQRSILHLGPFQLTYLLHLIVWPMLSILLFGPVVLFSWPWFFVKEYL